jgi:hypothetical protein
MIIDPKAISVVMKKRFSIPIIIASSVITSTLLLYGVYIYNAQIAIWSFCIVAAITATKKLLHDIFVEKVLVF